MARWLVYRFASPKYGKNSKDMAGLQKQFEYEISLGTLTPEALKKNSKFIDMFGQSLVKAYQGLFDCDFQEYRYPIVNAAPTLVEAAKLRNDAFGDYLAELLTDHDAMKDSKGTNKHDVIKLYALQGLRQFYGQCFKPDGYSLIHAAKPIIPVDADADVIGDVAKKKRDRDLRYIGAVLKFAENKSGAAKRPYEEQEALRFFRRQAIETLSATQAPVVTYGKKTVEVPIAAFLLRVLAPKSDLEPAPNMAEKVEAAIGICHMKYKNVDAYQPEIGVYLVGQFLADFMNEAIKDSGPISNGKIAAMHWRVDAKRLELALKDLVANAKARGAGDAKGKGPTIDKRAKDLADAAVPLLKTIGQSKFVATNPMLDTPSQALLNTFRNVMAKNNPRPASNQVFKDMPKYTIELGE
jgi:hypothetical protein